MLCSITDPTAEQGHADAEVQRVSTGIDREQVNYINAHATSTLVGDIAEVKAVRSVFSNWSHIKMNGTKSLVGHCLGAAAGVEAIATIQAIVRGEVHPTINHEVCPRHPHYEGSHVRGSNSMKHVLGSLSIVLASGDAGLQNILYVHMCTR
jgi:3-oxoacyl-(acyl-carrier-protein) synthase